MKDEKKVKIHIKKGDKVVSLTGKDRRKPASEVIEVFPDKYKALVKGFNLVKKHKKPTQQDQQGEIIQKEAPIHISNLMLVVDGAKTRIGRRLNDKGKLQRFSKKSGEFID
jgi:large subunit ribosomal protein L24